MTPERLELLRQWSTPGEWTASAPPTPDEVLWLIQRAREADRYEYLRCLKHQHPTCSDCHGETLKQQRIVVAERDEWKAKAERLERERHDWQVHVAVGLAEVSAKAERYEAVLRGCVDRMARAGFGATASGLRDHACADCGAESPSAGFRCDYHAARAALKGETL